jgi:hypothetical protein
MTAIYRTRRVPFVEIAQQMSAHRIAAKPAAAQPAALPRRVAILVASRSWHRSCWSSLVQRV